MAQTAADVMVGALKDWGVKVIFGLPGDGINGIMESLRKEKDAIQFIQVRHEETAAFMACGYAKFTGQLGVCLATSGPGGIHLLNGLYDAKLDGAPVLAITGMPYHDLIGTYTQQDVALDKLFMDVAAYNERVMGPAHVRNITDLACRSALSAHGVAHITFPVDLQDLEVKDTTKRNVPGHSSDAWARPAGQPAEQDLAAAAAILNAASKVVILAGRGALGASNELQEIAAKLKAPIVKALLGKASVPDDNPYAIGGIGLLGSLPAQQAMQECDTLLLVGTSFPYIEFLPEPGQARAVQIDIDATRIGLRYPVDVGLVGSSERTLRQLIERVQPKTDTSFLDQALSRMTEWWELMEERGTRPEKPMKPQVAAWELGKRLESDAVVACDSGTITTWWARQIPVREGQMHSVSGTLASMACGLPYAMAAQVAYPGRQCVAFVGDGGLSMLMAELATCVKYQLPVKVIVVKNDTLGQIKWEQIAFLGNPEYGVDLQSIDFVKVAEACGLPGIRIEEQANCGAQLDDALSRSGPVLVEAVVDGLEPPMPAKVTREQAENFLKALAKGQPDAQKIGRNVLGQKIRELI